MSGGFFRGTSTDQDSRFSNKKAKLLKSQKFASELETLVDMTKVKMDVMKPWIAKRVTELIGFEDEVLINFIYGLLEGKEVNGKEVQISLTGFMERNTGKFMKELWLLLLSAQQNLSGVPQQFLDAKEEETKNKKAETDRIANEIQRKRDKEKQELDQERIKMDGDGDESRNKHSELELNIKPHSIVPNNLQADEEARRLRKLIEGRCRSSRSPDLAYWSSSRRKKHTTPPIKSFSKSRSYSDERRSSRSVSRSPSLRSGSISSERRYPTSPRQSPLPWRKHVQYSPSPPRHRSYHSKRRSRSPSKFRSPSPIRPRKRRYDSRSPLQSFRLRSRTPVRNSPVRHRSPSPLRRRSPTPKRHRSSFSRRSRSPARRRSPHFVRRRSPSSQYDRSSSPQYRRPRSPLRHKPPSLRRQSRSPVRQRYERSPSTPMGRSVSPFQPRLPVLSQKKSFTPASGRTPQKSSSSSPIRRSSFSPVRRSPPQSPGERLRDREKHSPARRPSPSERSQPSAMNHRGSKPVERKPVISLRSPQRDTVDRDDFHENEPSSLSKLKSTTESDTFEERGHPKDHRFPSPHGNNPHERRERIIRPQSPSPMLMKASHPDSSGTSDDGKNNYQSSEKVPDRRNHKGHHETQEFTEAPKTNKGEDERESYVSGPDRTGNKISTQADDSKGNYPLQELGGTPKLSRKSDLNGRNGSMDSPSKEPDEHKTEVKEKRKHKRSDRHEVESEDYSSYDSYEERKAAKRRRKEEKKLKKEERRQRRDERHRRKAERRAEKRKLRSVDTDGNPSPYLVKENSEDAKDLKHEARGSKDQEVKSARKCLEIELREKALESLRAKKEIGNSKK